jgi:hypothetical protein
MKELGRERERESKKVIDRKRGRETQAKRDYNQR